MSKKYLIIILIFFTFNILAALAFYQQKTIQSPRVTFLNVGQGDAALIEIGNDMQILIDGGDGKNILDKLGEHMSFYDRKIELVILTHPDKDHMGGLIEILKYYEVEQILETGIICETAICQEWDKLIEEKNISVKYAQFGQRIKAGNIKMTVLYPFENLQDKKAENDNESSIILRIDTENDSYLLTGDSGFKTEKKLIDENINIKAKVIKISHHGSKNATSNEFLRLVNPQKAVVSVGKNSYGHPAQELLNRLKNMNVAIFRTDEEGDVIFE
ncbi:MAG: MBL fold metallo-hydrolase [Candidatus Pacebacteria bacterium]|nr:MBL fold metallo-hydrolase [Candidatus Paceibacterota bacterium]